MKASDPNKEQSKELRGQQLLYLTRDDSEQGFRVISEQKHLQESSEDVKRA